MKKKFITLIILGIIAAPMGVLAAAERGYLSVNTSSNTEIAPDVAEISFAVRTFDVKSMQKATQANKEISDKLYSILSDMLDPKKGDFIKTSDYSASPVYTYSNGKRNFDKYEVSNRLIIHTKSIDKVGIIIDRAIAAGATNVDSLNFSVSNYDAQCNSLLENASKKALVRAEILAKAMNSSIEGIKSMDGSCNANNNYNQPRMYMAKNMLADSAVSETAASGTAINGGVIKIYANVSASFYVK